MEVLLLQFFGFFLLFSASFQSKLIVVVDNSDQNHVQYLKYINSSAKLLSDKELKVVSISITQNDTFDQLCFEVDRPDTFVLSLSSDPQVINDIKHFSNATNIPTIQVKNNNWTHTSLDHQDGNETEPYFPTYFNFITPNIIFDNVFKELIFNLNITECVILYDENYVPTPQLIEIFTQLNMVQKKKVVFTPMEKNVSAIPSQIISIKAYDFRHIIIMSSMANVNSYTTAGRFEMDHGYLNWYIVTMDINPYLCDTCFLTDTFWIRPDIDTTFRMFTKLEDYITEKLEHKEWIVLYDQITISFYYDLTSIIWSTLSSLSNVTQLLSAENYTCLTQANVSLITNLTATMFESSSMKGQFGEYVGDGMGTFFQNVLVVISNIYEDKKSRIIKTVGRWSITEGLDILYGSLRVNITTLNNYSIVISEAPPFIERYVDENGVAKYRGYCVDLIEYLQQELNFDYRMYVIKDSLYGSLNERGEWNGLIRDLINGHADMAVADLSVTAERENYVDFTVPYYDLVGVTILMKKDAVEYSLFKFMTVLTPPVWLCIVAAYFFTSFVMWLFDKYSPYGPKEEAKFTFTQCLWYCMTALTPQGGPEAPKNISCKLVAATWWLFGFIIIASYTANLAAFLTVARMESSISSLDDLSQQYKIKYAPVRGTASEAYFKRMANIEQRFYDIWKTVSMNESMTPQERASLAVWDYPVSDKYTNMWRFMNANGLPNSSLEAIKMVLESKSSDEGFAYIGDATSIRYATMTDCRLAMVGGEFNRKPYAIAVQQLSPLKDILSGTILKLSSDRKLEDLKDKWWKNNPNKLNCPEAETETSGISVKNIAGVFLVILGGIVFSIVTLIFEYFFIKNKDSTKIDNNMNKDQKVKKKKRNTNMIAIKTLNAS